MFAGLLLEGIEKRARPAVAFQAGQCLRTRLNSNACDICLSLCPKRALTLDGRAVVFDADLCSGCMACIPECPNDAFVGGFDLSSLFLALRGNEADAPVIFSCARGIGHGNRITIPCHGLFSEQVLALLNTAALQEFYLDVRRCADCDNGHVLSLLHTRVEAVRKKSGRTIDLKIRYLTGDPLKEVDLGQQRRFLLRLAKKTMVDFGRDASPLVSLRTPSMVSKDGGKKGATMISRLQEQAMDVLAKDAVQEQALLRSYYYTVQSNGKCDLCPLCTGMCPTGALKRTRAGKKKLEFTSALCSGCGLCRDFCQKQALTLRQGCTDDPKTPRTIAG